MNWASGEEKGLRKVPGRGLKSTFSCSMPQDSQTDTSKVSTIFQEGFLHTLFS